MNYFHVHPGDLKKQFTDLVIPNYPLAWHPNLGNVASGYDSIIIANAGVGPGFPHALAPYQDQSTFPAYAQRYTDGGYGPLSDLSGLGENVAPDNLKARPSLDFGRLWSTGVRRPMASRIRPAFRIASASCPRLSPRRALQQAGMGCRQRVTEGPGIWLALFHACPVDRRGLQGFGQKRLLHFRGRRERRDDLRHTGGGWHAHEHDLLRVRRI